MYNPNAKRRRIKPYARPTSFDYNVRFDIRQYQDVKYNRVRKPFFQSASQDEVFRVMEGELLAKSNMANARYNDKELHVFSFANGLAAPQNVRIGTANPDFLETTTNSMDEQKQVRAAILGSIQYMGVAVTEFHPGRDVYEQGMVATIAGLNTLYNNGAETIYPGQTVCMDLPVLRESSGGSHYKRALQMGVPREKLQFILRPHQDMTADYGDVSLVNRFIVGTAISYSRPGDTVDIILHRMNYTSTTVNGNLTGLGSVGNDPRVALLGKFLAKSVSDDDLDNAAKGVQEFESVVMRISDPDVQEAIDKARGMGAGSTSITSLLAPGSVLDKYDKNLRLQLLEDEGAAIAAVGATYTNTQPERDAIRLAINAPGSALTADDVKRLYDDVQTYLDGGAAQAVMRDGKSGTVRQILTVGAVAAVLGRLLDGAAAINAEFNTGGNAGKSLFADRNAAVDPGTGPKTYDDGTKAPGASTNGPLDRRSLSLLTKPPKISAAVGSGSKNKKKK